MVIICYYVYSPPPPHLRTFFIAFRKSGRGRERERERERNIDVVAFVHTYPDWGSKLQPVYVP